MREGQMVGWGILGCGEITDLRGAPAINALSDARIVAFQSRTPVLAADFAARHRAEKWTTDRSELLADPAITAVYVATEHHRHAEDVIAAAAAGKHVLCEKPMANSIADCRRMIDACRSHRVSLQIAYYRRYYPKVVRAKELLDAGAIGTPVSLQIHYSQRIPAERITPGNWRLQSQYSGGGALVDTGSHRLDLLCWLLGEPESVASLAENQEQRFDATDRESLLIRLVSGTHASSFHGYCAPSDDQFELVGTEGILSLTPLDGPRLRLLTPAGEEQWELPRHENVHQPLFEDFTLRLLAGQPPQFTGEDGILASRIIEAAYRAAASGRFEAA
jgi:1,5-anhydro-D-fructose reductase (1,5-anhydro-D-mannitol-forming)